ncbi:MAG TPA: adenylate/guanylate cyclase domain-containing protein [Candidatus Ozemobacteraceae bacterium]|nr:adenylate/guanylate cyclase domain-containing protein [Candidatus Ozemobacteraceae bacterium]
MWEQSCERNCGSSFWLFALRENIDFINEYLSHVGPVIRDNRGFIDKYIGDAVMALFEQSPDDAVNAAIASLRPVVEFNELRQRRGEKPIRIGIGLNTGTLMLGTVGEHNRINATVISDAVNLASRVEGQTKTYGAEILITETTFKSLIRPHQYLIRTVDTIQVKG